MNPFEQARRYLASIPPAVSGQGGHNQTFSAACALVWGFELSELDAMSLLREWNMSCQPPWSDAELVHKVQTVHTTAHQKPRGHLINRRNHSPTNSPMTQQQPEKPDVKGRTYELADETSIPAPMVDGTRRLLEAAFLPGEGVRIVPAVVQEDGSAVPENRGPCISREDWLRRLSGVDGDPDRIWRREVNAGLFITINPMKIGGSKDADVTVFRHALIEFDTLSAVEQWGLYQASGIPCTAIISSGGKSVHAWVRVDAKDRREYDERVNILYEHFAAYSPDKKNKNPSRLSRLANCIRFGKRQELLALNVGAESFTAWQAQQQAEGIGRRLPIRRLLKFNPDGGEDTLIGNRWVCRGGSILWVGQSGIGKSSLNMQLAVLWALGLPAFGVTPVRSLKSLVIQAENDEGDTAEMLQGVLTGMGKQLDDAGIAEDFDIDTIEKHLVIIRDSSHTGEAFTQAIRRLIDLHQPDLVWLDPLLSFIGDDVSKQEVCGRFLRNWLNPIADATGVAWMMVHHTGKPSNDSKAQKHWKSNDFSYYGIGSSELTNWARGVVALRLVSKDEYELTFAKRGPRAGAKELDGQVTTGVTLKHSSKGIFWEQVDTSNRPKDEPNEPKRTGAPSKKERLLKAGLGPFLDACQTEGEGESKNAIAARLNAYAETLRMDIHLSTCKAAIDDLLERGALRITNGKYFKP